jgi:hypothetical protein
LARKPLPDRRIERVRSLVSFHIPGPGANKGKGRFLPEAHNFLVGNENHLKRYDLNDKCG